MATHTNPALIAATVANTAAVAAALAASRARKQGNTPAPEAPAVPLDLPTQLDALRRAWQAATPGYAQRRDDLLRLRAALKRRLPEMADAIAADFGHRSRHESLLADGMTVLAAIDHLLRHLRRWMKPQRVAVGWRLWPARAQLRHQPLGVVGVI